MTPKLYTQEELDAAVERERGRVIGIFVGELQKLHEKTVLDCGDNSCLFATRRGGMRTNGGCRCIERLLDAAVAREREARDVLERGLAAVEALIVESRGVDGLHLNGDTATWDELRSGGRFEEWLRDFDAALRARSAKGV